MIQDERRRLQVVYFSLFCVTPVLTNLLCNLHLNTCAMQLLSLGIFFTAGYQCILILFLHTMLNKSFDFNSTLNCIVYTFNSVKNKK